MRMSLSVPWTGSLKNVSAALWMVYFSSSLRAPLPFRWRSSAVFWRLILSWNSSRVSTRRVRS